MHHVRPSYRVRGPQKARASGDGKSNCPSSASDTISGDIKIGVSAPLSGQQSALGQLSVGFNKYIDYVNSQGGINGRKLDVTILDDKGDPAQAVANAQKLITQDHVDTLAGISSTPQNLAIAPIAVQSCMADVFVASGNPDLVAGKYQGSWRRPHLSPPRQLPSPSTLSRRSPRARR